jgi:hypothetical protein
MSLAISELEKTNLCEYWLLDNMMTNHIFTRGLLPNENESIDIPPFVNIFSAKNILSCLIKLFDNGFLVANKNRNNLDKFIPNNLQIYNALHEEININSSSFFVSLTRKGGQKWESLSNPKWRTYTTLLWEKETDRNGVFEALILGKELLWVNKRIANFFVHPRLHLYDNLYPRMIEKRMLTIVPYKPIYWKNMGRCYCVRIEYELVDRMLVDQNKLNLFRKNVINVPNTSLETYWYTHPYEEFHSQVRQKLQEMGCETH